MSRLFSDSNNTAMPDPPAEFINLASSTYGNQTYTTHQASTNVTKTINTDNRITIHSSTERKLVPILKTTPTLPRSNHNLETNANIN